MLVRLFVVAGAKSPLVSHYFGDPSREKGVRDYATMQQESQRTVSVFLSLDEASYRSRNSCGGVVLLYSPGLCRGAV